MECAILYESGFNRLVDKVIVVTAPLDIRISRITSRDKISKEKASNWIERQWSQDEIVRRADFVIVNDGLQSLDKQIDAVIKEIGEIKDISGTKK